MTAELIDEHMSVAHIVFSVQSICLFLNYSLAIEMNFLNAI